MIKFIVAIILGLGLTACVSSPDSAGSNTNLTFGAVKSQIVKGQTTQPEVIRLLGSPNLTSKNRAGQEVWTYSKTASASESKKVGGGLGIFGMLGSAAMGGAGVSGSKAVDTTSVSTFDLIITFTGNDIVEDYSVVTSKF